MKSLRRLGAAIAALVFTVMTMSPAGIVFGSFTDPDQNDATLRVVGITANDEPAIEYPAVRAWGTFIVVIPGHGNHVNLVAYDEDGNKAVHRSLYMLRDGSCVDR